MTIARITIASLFVAVAATFAANANAAGYHDIDSQAVSLQNKASTLYWEFNNHFRHASHYGHLRSDSAQLYGLARDIHLLAHSSHGLDQMGWKLDRADQLFHHLEETVEHIEHDSVHGDGHVHGYIGHVHQLMNSMERTLHQLRAEVKDLQHHNSHPHFDDHFGGGHSGHDDHGHGNSGVTFGSRNGSFRIRFGN